jgi:hypothetical protein
MAFTTSVCPKEQPSLAPSAADQAPAMAESGPVGTAGREGNVVGTRPRLCKAPVFLCLGSPSMIAAIDPEQIRSDHPTGGDG